MTPVEQHIRQADLDLSHDLGALSEVLSFIFSVRAQRQQRIHVSDEDAVNESKRLRLLAAAYPQFHNLVARVLLDVQSAHGVGDHEGPGSPTDADHAAANHMRKVGSACSAIIGVELTRAVTRDNVPQYVLDNGFNALDWLKVDQPQLTAAMLDVVAALKDHYADPSPKN